MFYGVYELYGKYGGGVYDNYDLWHSDTFCPDTEIIAYFDFKAHGKTYEQKKACIENAAIDYSNSCGLINLSWYDLSIITSFFDTYGKRYHLTEEFTENGII